MTTLMLDSWILTAIRLAQVARCAVTSGLGSVSHTGIGNNNANNDGTVHGTNLWYSPTGQPYSAYIIYRDYGDVATAPPLSVRRWPSKSPRMAP